MVNLEQFVLESCEYLGIKAAKMEQTDCYQLIFPEKYLSEFAQPEMKICFRKSNDSRVTYLTKESFLVKKLANLVDKINLGVASGTRNINLDNQVINLTKIISTDCKIQTFDVKEHKEDTLLIWYKITIPGYFVEEIIRCLEYNYLDGKIKILSSSEINILDQIQDDSVENIASEALETAFDSLTNYISSHANEIYSIKQQEIESKIKKEINRINEYYQKLQAEANLSVTKARSAAEELDLLKKERDNLIDQQKKKYFIQKNDVKIEPIAILLVRNQIEQGKVIIHNKYGRYGMGVKANFPINIKCQETGDTTGPFTVTSDKEIILVKNSLECQGCNKLKRKSSSAQCAVCNKYFCPDCNVESQVSTKIVCKEHSRKCSLCDTICSTDEFPHTCVSCGQNYCEKCINISCSVCGQKVCSTCLKYSFISGDPLCNKHSETCQCCHGTCKEHELYKCSNCNQVYCKKCNPNGTCELCATLKPIKNLNYHIQKIIESSKVSSSKYEVSESEYRLYILGKGLMFKSFLICYDKTKGKVIELIKYGVFNRRKS